MKKGAGGHGPGQAKLLDFGLARLVQGAQLNGQGVSATDASVPRGTVPYMAPEQLEGRPADARTDVFAFGAVLYEMLTGRRAFEGASPAGVIAAILEHEPLPAVALQPAIPPSVDRAVRRCLAKDPDARWQTASDLAAELRWLLDTNGAGTGVVAAARPSLWRRIRLAAAAILLVTAGAALTWFIRPPSTVRGGCRPEPRPRPGPDQPHPSVIHARRIANVHRVERGRPHAGVLRRQGRCAPALPPEAGRGRRTAARRAPTAPLRWPCRPTAGGSPSGRPGRSGRCRSAAALRWCLASNLPNPHGMAWDDAGNLYFGGEDRRISVIEAGGALKPVTTVSDGETAPRAPVASARRQSPALHRSEGPPSSWGDEEVVALTLATGQRKRLLTGAADARYLPSGHLVFLRRGALMAVAFDAERLELRGTPEAMLDVGRAGAHREHQQTSTPAQASSRLRPLVRLPGSGAPWWSIPTAALVRVDRRGQDTPSSRETRGRTARTVRVSPDGRRLAVTVMTSTTGGLWVYDLESAMLTPIQMGWLDDVSPRGGRQDGRRLAFNWSRRRTPLPGVGARRRQWRAPGARPGPF